MAKGQKLDRFDRLLGVDQRGNPCPPMRAWTQAAADEPAALVPMADSAPAKPGPELAAPASPPAGTEPRSVRLRTDLMPDDLAPGTYFERLVGAALDRTPVHTYPGVRAHLKAAARARTERR